MTRLFFVVLFMNACFTPALARRAAYPQGYFRNPLRIPILLAGNFGECRPGHFHSGIDIKTGGHEGEPVYAAADGYISRIKMEPGGFGHGLYITHPNGYTTLYAHLADFVPPIQQAVRQQQYAKESWTVDLQFSPQQFPVKKGGQIAWSGNTGGSTAPHLHFEIRDTKTEHPLNPQLFGFKIKDTQPPLPTQLALYMNKPRGVAVLHPLHREGRFYTTKDDTLRLRNEIISFGIVADDFMEGSDNTLAFYTAEWYVDDSLQGRIRLDDIGYDETRYVNAYADYGAKLRGGPWVQRLYQLPGNRLSRIYEALNAQGGSMYFPPYESVRHSVRIVLTDVYGNSSEVRFAIAVRAMLMSVLPQGEYKPFYAGRMNTVAYSNISFYLDESALYENTRMPISTVPDSSAISLRFTVGSSDEPVHHYFDLQLKPNVLIPFALRGKVAMIYSDGDSDISGRAATPAEQGWYKASVRALGGYRLVIDTAAPLVRWVGTVGGNMSKAQRIAFRVTDVSTSVKIFRGEIDGAWVLFEQHGDVWTYVFDGHCGNGRHTLVINAADELGNAIFRQYTFTR